MPLDIAIVEKFLHNPFGRECKFFLLPGATYQDIFIAEIDRFQTEITTIATAQADARQRDFGADEYVALLDQHIAADLANIQETNQGMLQTIEKQMNAAGTLARSARTNEELQQFGRRTRTLERLYEFLSKQLPAPGPRPGN